MLGVNQDEFAESLVQNLEECTDETYLHEDLNPPADWGPKMKYMVPIEAQNLYCFTRHVDQIEKCNSRKVLRSFCFPDSVRVAKLDSFHQMEKLVLSQF